jgi:hypothetical protein
MVQRAKAFNNKNFYNHDVSMFQRNQMSLPVDVKESSFQFWNIWDLICVVACDNSYINTVYIFQRMFI